MAEQDPNNAAHMAAREHAEVVDAIKGVPRNYTFLTDVNKHMYRLIYWAKEASGRERTFANRLKKDAIRRISSMWSRL